MKKTIGVSALLLGFFCLALYLLIYHSDIYLFFFDRKRLAEFVRSFGRLSALIFIALQIFQVLFAPIPGEVTGFLGGFLFGNFLGVLYSTIGLGLGSWLAFAFARWAGQPLVERIVAYKTIRRFDYLMSHQGTWIAFLLFLIPGFPKDYLCYIMGLGHMDLKTFLIISTAGRFLGTVLLTIQGHLVREKNYLVLGIIIALTLILLLAAYLFRRRLELYFRRHRRLHRLHLQKRPAPEGAPTREEGDS
jgi:uncharacterized membrane protein YdjX (TVP38/TMEM64 family)